MSNVDARYRTKYYLDQNLDRDNLTKDDGATPAEYIVAYALPDYSLVRVFKDKLNDVVFSVGTPESTALPMGVGYEENIPITIFAVDKTGVTGTKQRWTAEAELRRVVEENPIGSLRNLTRITDNEQKLGSTTLYSVNYVLKYKRYA